MNIKTEIEYLEAKREALLNHIRFLEANRDFLEGLDVRTFESCGTFHLSGLDREQTLAVIKHFGGHWDKSYHEAMTHFTRTEPVSGARIEIYDGTPPETCRIVEEKVHVPAHDKLVRRVVCEKTVEVGV